MTGIALEVVTPRNVVVQVEASEVILPGRYGEMTVLPDHAELTAQLKPGILRYAGAEGSGAFVIAGGFAQVARNRLLVLTRAVQTDGDADLAALNRGLQEASRRLESLSMEDPTYAVVQEEVEYLDARIGFTKKS